MSKPLVIVESPTKVKTISKILGSEYTVKSSVGHVRDLPRNTKSIPPEYIKEEILWGAVIPDNFENIYVTPEDRKKITRLFRSNEIDIVFTVNIFNEGVDFPDVECLLMLRPTQSQLIMSQQLGRGLRISRKKEHVSVLDFVNNDRNRLEKFQFLGFGEKPKKEKETYYYDNNGNKVIFDYSIYNNFLRLQSEQSRVVDFSKVSQKWIAFGEALKKYYANNYYWNVGKQEKDFKKVLTIIQIIDENPNIGTTGQEILIKERKLGTNIRAIDKGKTLGFITGKGDNKKTTGIYKAAKLRCNGEWDKLELYKDILEQQLQKVCFFGPQNSDVNKHGNTIGRVPPSDLFSILYFPFIYKVIIEVGAKTGDYFISLDEFNFFVVTSTNHFDYEDKVKLIVELRNEPVAENLEIIKYLNKISAGDGTKGSELDTRIKTLFEYSTYLDISDSKISIDKSSIRNIEEMLNDLERLLEEGSIQMHTDDPERYLTMLHTSGVPWQES